MSSETSRTARMFAAVEQGISKHQHPPRWLCAFMAALVLVICVPPMLVGLGARDSTHTMENVAVVVSQETWLRAHQSQDYHWFLTYNDQRVRVVKPPLVTWMHMLAWADLEPETATPDQLIERARLMAVAMGAMTILAIFWSALTLADLRLAVAAALIAGTTVFLQRQSRTASYDIHFTAWAALSVAAGVWAMAPRETVVRIARVAVGWMLCGIMLAAAAYSKNPLAYAVVGVPLVIAAIVLQRRRGRNIVGVCAAIAVSLALVLPWYVAVNDVVNQAGAKLLTEFQAEREHPQPFFYYIGLIALVAPWPMWLIAGLAHPFVDGRRLGLQRRVFVWLWFMAILVLFSIPGAKQQRYILPIMPAAALLMGYVWNDHHALLRRGQTPSAFRTVVFIHGLSLLAVSIAFGVFLGWQRWFLHWFERDGAVELVFGDVTWPTALLIMAVLSALAATAWRFHAKRHPMRCVVATAVWAALLLSVIWWTYGDAPSGHHAIKPIARNERALIGDAPIRSLRLPDVDDNYILNEEFRIYFGRQIPWIGPDELESFARQADERGYVLARQTERHDAAMQEAGYLPVREVRTDKHITQTLWQRR